jgi:hypothetical protein
MEKIIKVSSGRASLAGLLLRQTPKQQGIWKDCKFLVNQNIKQCDAWFVLHHSGLLKEESSFCDPSKVFYISMEPSESIGSVSREFINQFSTIVSCDTTINHRQQIKKNIHTWWAGINVDCSKGSHLFSPEVNLTYDNFFSQYITEKSRIDRVCCILSKKQLTSGHKLRLAFFEKLMSLPAGKHIDCYGAIGRDFLDKYDILSKYKYALVLENSLVDHYWSEKLADSYLCGSFPFYSGCINLNDYFPPESYQAIDISSPERTSSLICSTIAEDRYSMRINHLQESRNRILIDYNVFNIMHDLVLREPSKPKSSVNLKPNAYFTETATERVRRKLSQLKMFLTGKT